MHALNQGSFVIALEGFELHSGGFCTLCQGHD
jgi:hypothetical protein